MQFPKKRELVKQVQRHLAIDPDGVDGKGTWYRISMVILGESHLALRGMNPAPSGVSFIGRSGLVKAVQRKLGITVDGEDGSETWSAICEFFFPAQNIIPSPADAGDFAQLEKGRSPNRNKGRNECLGIVVHHACGYFNGTIDWCMKPGTNAAYHCLVAEDGTRAILGRDEDCCHHAGKSKFLGRTSCNYFTLGIAFCGDTNTGAMRKTKELSSVELESAVEWIRTKMALHNIPLSSVTTHRVISPGRKDDLSPAAWIQVQQSLGM